MLIEIVSKAKKSLSIDYLTIEAPTKKQHPIDYSTIDQNNI